MPEVLEKDVAYVGTNITLPTTTETLVLTSPAVVMPVATARVFIRATVALTPGTGTTFYNVRIRRGATVAGPLIGRVLGQALLGAAGSEEHADITALDAVENVSAVQYSVTVQQAGATANGTVTQAAIAVEVLNG